MSAMSRGHFATEQALIGFFLDALGICQIGCLSKEHLCVVDLNVSMSTAYMRANVLVGLNLDESYADV